MKVGITFFEDRVSPVFDVSRNLVLIEVQDGRIEHRDEKVLRTETPAERAREISGLDVKILICGAISSAFETALISEGIRVISCTCGQVDEITDAYINGLLTERAFLMPGCTDRRMNRGRNTVNKK